jgi:hypothetical protein
MEAHGSDLEMFGRHFERLAEVLLILGWDYYPRRTACLERALEPYRRVDAPEAMTRVHLELASVYSNINTLNLQRSTSHFQSAEALLSQNPHATLRRLLYRIQSNHYAWTARTAEGLEASRRAISIDAALAPEDRLGVPTATTGWHLGWHQATHLQAEAGAPRLDALVVLFPEPLIAFRRGDWERARAEWTEVLERLRGTGARWCLADFACWLVRVYRVQGEIAAAEALLRESLGSVARLPAS